MRGPLAITNVTVVRGGRIVVRDASLEVAPGSVTALLGPNGAGKSSLVLAIGGLLAVRSGTIDLDDLTLAGRRPEIVRAAGVAIVPEGRRLLPSLSTRDNLRVATYPLSNGDARTGLAYVLDLFPELQPLLGREARTLSGGEQQMVVLAQALVSRPRFLLIDELSLGLAPVVVNRLIPTLAGVAESGIGVLLVEQFTSLALMLAQRAYVMEGGEIRFDGTAEDLRAHPDLLHSAYLLGGVDQSGARADASHPT